MEEFMTGTEQSISQNIPGIERKSVPIPESRWPLATIATHHCKPSVTVVMGGELSQSSTGSVIDGVLNVSKLLKYLFRDGCGWHT
jgi:hypothetical protein